MTKKCPKCNLDFPATTEFFFRHKGLKDGLSCWCKVCLKQWASEKGNYLKSYNRRYQQINKRKKRDCEMRHDYGITIKEYEQKLEEQNGMCAICKKPETVFSWGKIKALAIDHNHITGQLRGLLCNNCNRAIGLMKDDIDNVKAMLDYMIGYQIK